jgi:hypothetical protein
MWQTCKIRERKGQKERKQDAVIFRQRDRKIDNIENEGKRYIKIERAIMLGGQT